MALFTPRLEMSLWYSSESNFKKYLTVMRPEHDVKTPRALELFATSILF
jgi:hypothetical protein